MESRRFDVGTMFDVAISISMKYRYSIRVVAKVVKDDSNGFTISWGRKLCEGVHGFDLLIQNAINSEMI